MDWIDGPDSSVQDWPDFTSLANRPATLLQPAAGAWDKPIWFTVRHIETRDDKITDLKKYAENAAASGTNFYVLFGIDALASNEDIRRAWKHAVQKYRLHPDQAGANYDKAQYLQFELARDVLLDANARDTYNKALEAPLHKVLGYWAIVGIWMLVVYYCNAAWEWVKTSAQDTWRAVCQWFGKTFRWGPGRLNWAL
ncbi:hypothetical protein VTK56DRAFT_4641 [Thermocarpiscus australiensis]